MCTLALDMTCSFPVATDLLAPAAEKCRVGRHGRVPSCLRDSQCKLDQLVSPVRDYSGIKNANFALRSLNNHEKVNIIN